jgi:hypothetical protein
MSSSLLVFAPVAGFSGIMFAFLSSKKNIKNRS